MERFDTSLEEYDVQEGPVYWSDDNTLRIDEVNSPIKPYLKVYKAEEDAFEIYKETTKMCRLSLDTLEYVDGVGSNWILSNEEFDQIKAILNSPCKFNLEISILDYIKQSWEKNKEEISK